MSKTKELTRRQIRYLLFRLRTQEIGGAKAPTKLPRGFKKSFTEQPKFRGWASFGVTWDVAEKPDSPWTIVFRDKSLEQEWNEVLIEKVPVLTEDGEIVEAEEWEQRQHSTQ